MPIDIPNHNGYPWSGTWDWYESGGVTGWWHRDPYHETNLAAILQYPDGNTYNQYYFTDYNMSGNSVTVPNTVYNNPNWGLTTQTQKRAARLGMDMGQSGWWYYDSSLNNYARTTSDRWYRTSYYLSIGLSMSPYHPYINQGYTQTFDTINNKQDSLAIPGYSTGVASLTWGDYKSVISGTASQLSDIWSFSYNLGF